MFSFLLYPVIKISVQWNNPWGTVGPPALQLHFLEITTKFNEKDFHVGFPVMFIIKIKLYNNNNNTLMYFIFVKGNNGTVFQFNL